MRPYGVIDSRDPHAQAGSWAGAPHYEAGDNSAFTERLLEPGALPGETTVGSHGRPAFRDLIAARHPADPCDQDRGTVLGRLLLFQRGLGASVLRHVEEPAGEWVVTADPEGNEFCVS